MLVELVELACNQALEHEPAARHELAKLQGQVVILEIRNLNQRIVIQVMPHGIELTTEDQQDAAVTLAATTSALLKIVRYGMQDAPLAAGELEISGDPIVAQRFSKIVSELNVDWEGLLGEHIGELPAAYVSRGLHTAGELLAEGGQALKNTINRTIKDDLNLVADSQEVERFLEEVDALRAAVDRLQARLTRLQAAS